MFIVEFGHYNSIFVVVRILWYCAQDTSQS